MQATPSPRASRLGAAPGTVQPQPSLTPAPRPTASVPAEPGALGAPATTPIAAAPRQRYRSCESGLEAQPPSQLRRSTYHAAPPLASGSAPAPAPPTAAAPDAPAAPAPAAADSPALPVEPDAPPLPAFAKHAARTASSARSEGNLFPSLGSTRITPVWIIAALISAGVSVGLHSSISAATPAAEGDACEVPQNVEVPLRKPSDVIGAPVVTRSTRAGVLLKQVI